VHPAFAAWLVRDLTAALADLQRRADDIAHGALTPDRIIMTPDGRVMIVEHVLGAALDCLQRPPDRLWLDFGVLTPVSELGAGRFDRRTDVIQLGWMVLSALVGRRLTAAEYPLRVEGLLDEFVRLAGPRSPALVAALRCWLERALQVKGEVFASAIDAHHALFELRVHGGPQTIAFTARRHTSDPFAPEPPRELPAADPPTSALEPSMTTALVPQEQLSSEIATMTAATDVIAELRARNRAEGLRHFDARVLRTARLGWTAALVFATLAVVEGVALRRLYLERPTAAPVVAPPVTFESMTPGDAVLVNGRPAGVTPLTLTLGADIRSIVVQARAPLPAVVDAAAQTGSAVDHASDPATAAAAAAIANARERRGGLRIVSPVEVQVLEGERVLGSTADGPIVTTAGRHELDFINTAVGYRSRQVVDIRAGQIVRMNVTMPDGRVSVNAVPWAQVFINGNAVGDTPLANLPLPVGEHQITFRHPQLGEQTQRVVVKSGALTRVSATLAR
jgi:hypothetical protein